MDLRKVNVIEHRNTQMGSESNVAYDAYSYGVKFECKGNASCVKRYKDASKTSKSYGPRDMFSRLVYTESGEVKYVNHDNVQEFYKFYDYAARAAAACQGKPIPSPYQGGKG